MSRTTTTKQFARKESIVERWGAIGGKLTLAARVSLSPDSPTQMFRHNLRICRSRITFFVLSFLILGCSAAALAGVFAAGCKYESLPISRAFHTHTRWSTPPPSRRLFRGTETGATHPTQINQNRSMFLDSPSPKKDTAFPRKSQPHLKYAVHSTGARAAHRQGYTDGGPGAPRFRCFTISTGVGPKTRHIPTLLFARRSCGQKDLTVQRSKK